MVSTPLSLLLSLPLLTVALGGALWALRRARHSKQSKPPSRSDPRQQLDELTSSLSLIFGTDQLLSTIIGRVVGITGADHVAVVLSSGADDLPAIDPGGGLVGWLSTNETSSRLGPDTNTTNRTRRIRTTYPARAARPSGCAATGASQTRQEPDTDFTPRHVVGPDNMASAQTLFRHSAHPTCRDRDCGLRGVVGMAGEHGPQSFICASSLRDNSDPCAGTHATCDR